MHLNLGEDKAKEVLLDVGYYRMGFYWHPLEKDNNHNFKEGAKFSDALDLYYLDSDLRHVFIKFLNRIEVNFKTKLIDEASNHYQTKPTCFADPSIMKKGFINQLPNYYDERFKNNNLIKDLEITRPNQVWVSDITYIRTVKGFCYLALITDLYSRKIVGYDLSDSLELGVCGPSKRPC